MSHIIHRTNEGADTMGIKHSASYQSEENMAKNSSGRLADVLVRNLNGEFDETGMELRPEFKKANTADADTEVTIHAIEIDD